MSEKNKNHFFKDESIKSEKVPVDRSDVNRTKTETPFYYLCKDPNDPKRNLKTLPKFTSLIILSKKNDPWIEVQTMGQISERGFVLSMFLEEVKNDR